VVIPLAEAFAVREPEADLMVSGLNCVRTVDNVASNINAEISTDSARKRIRRLSGSEHDAAGSNGTVTLPDHGAHGSRDHVLD